MKYLLLLFITLQATQTSCANTKSTEEQLSKLVKDSCNKKVVLLGEGGNHGGGDTIALKTKILKRLVEECGFSAVFFESSVYEFINLDHSIKNNTASKKQLANSIGGIWSFTKEIKPLIDFLFTKTKDGKIKLAGLDMQTGSISATFVQTKLAKKLTNHLSKETQQQCNTELFNNFNWLYNENNPYNQNTIKKLKNCANMIIESITKLNETKGNQELKLMAENFYSNLNNSFNSRDEQMYKNFIWHKSRLNTDEKIVIWTATIHAVKDSSEISEKIKPLGVFIQERFKDNSFVVGFSAFSGEYFNLMQGKAVAIRKPSKGSLEAQTIGNSSKDVVYINPTQLKSLGKISSYLTSYDKPKTLNWYKLVDAVLVHKKETSTNRIKSKSTLKR